MKKKIQKKNIIPIAGLSLILCLLITYVAPKNIGIVVLCITILASIISLISGLFISRFNACIIGSMVFFLLLLRALKIFDPLNIVILASFTVMLYLFNHLK